LTRSSICLLAAFVVGCASTHPEAPQSAPVAAAESMKLGNFSVSLTVKDLAASRAFYEKLGFRTIMGEPAKHWLILQNETCTIGLFQGMFEKNTLTFNPGWDRNAATLSEFQDVRALQRELKSRGLAPTVPADESTSGPAFFMLADPDGNPILFDQHVPKPGK
jgi:catechol 2,3-dioxygenase-like lactoylglutathione lyase family enzyme